MALFFRLLPNRTLALKDQKCHGGKQSRQRLRVLLCVNMDRSNKRIPLVVGKRKRPRCFSGRSLPVKYVGNTKVWMTRALFTDWLMERDSDMVKRYRKICLLVDNCSAHHVEGLVLKNIELEFFPANCTSLIQPLDQGIIHSVTCSYRKRLIEKMLFNLQLKRDKNRHFHGGRNARYFVASDQKGGHYQLLPQRRDTEAATFPAW